MARAQVPLLISQVTDERLNDILKDAAKLIDELRREHFSDTAE